MRLHCLENTTKTYGTDIHIHHNGADGVIFYYAVVDSAVW